MADESKSSTSSYYDISDPCTVVLFGASGDLAKRKVLPAMYDLAVHNSLGRRYAIVGFARSAMTDDSFRQTAGDAAKTISEVGPIDPQQWSDFASRLYYQQGDYGDSAAYTRLAARLQELQKQQDLGGNLLFYLSTPPEVYFDIIEQIGKAGLAKPSSGNAWVRIIV